MAKDTEPFVSVVTPFHNTAEYLAECIESVLKQTYSNWEYILVDNCSTDASFDIAARYAGRDSRIRLLRRSSLLTQVENYNAALREISSSSKYCKIVQADDAILPDCIRQMVAVAESDASIGLVSSLQLAGTTVRGQGLPGRMQVYPGKDIAQWSLRERGFVFGTPTSVMYRADIVRAADLFYDPAMLHEDTDACYRILKDSNFGFVHQALTFWRTDNESISSRVRDVGPHHLDRYLMARKYAHTFFSQEDAAELQRDRERRYWKFIAQSWLAGAPDDFWAYHRRGLATSGLKLSISKIAWPVAIELGRRIRHPKKFVRAVARRVGFVSEAVFQ